MRDHGALAVLFANGDGTDRRGSPPGQRVEDRDTAFREVGTHEVGERVASEHGEQKSLRPERGDGDGRVGGWASRGDGHVGGLHLVARFG